MIKKRCFVIMPFSDTEHHTNEYWTRHFKSYLKPLIEKSGEIEGSRSEPLRGDISSKIITDLVSSEIVVADLTDHNPNVFWELGVRQSFKYCTVTIAEKGTQIPFHFSHKGILFYNGEHLDNEEFEKSFLACLTDCINNPNEPDSPVLEVMGGRGTLYGLIHKEEINRRLASLLEEVYGNEKILVKLYEDCLKNYDLRKENKTEKCSFPGISLTLSAIELLYVNRYLDASEEFYSSMSGYYKVAESVNQRLNDWNKKEGCVIEKWFLEKHKVITKRFDAFKAELGKLNKV